MSHLIFIDEYGASNSDFYALLGVYINGAHYLNSVVPALHDLRVKHLHAELAPLHDQEFRKGSYPYYAFSNIQRVLRPFYQDFVALLPGFNYKLVLAVIDQKGLKGKYVNPIDAHKLALQFILEKFDINIISRLGGFSKVILEARGKQKDQQLRCIFAKKCLVGKSYLQSTFEPFFYKKGHLVPGLELADLLLASAWRIEVHRRGNQYPGNQMPKLSHYDQQVYNAGVGPKYLHPTRYAVKFFP